MFQELGPDKFWVSESIFGTLFAMFVIWTFTPFVTQRKRFYTVVMWSRLLMVLVGTYGPDSMGSVKTGDDIGSVGGSLEAHRSLAS